MFNNSHEAVFIVRVDKDAFRYIRSNASYQKLTGLSLGDIRYKTPVEIMGMETGEAITADFQRCIDEGKQIHFEETMEFPAGEKVWLTTLTPVFEKGKIKYILGSRQDISLQKKAEQEREYLNRKLFEENEFLRVTMESIGDGMVATDYLGRITFMNKAAEEIIGWQQKEVVGKPFKNIFKLFNEQTGLPVEDPIAKVMVTGKLVGLANHTSLKTRNGKTVPIADSAAPITDSKGQIFGVVMVFRDVSAEKEHQKQILYLSYYDALTGLYNRRFMEEEIERLDTSRQLPITVIMGDLNGLKLTNDVFGHAAGDQLLKKAADLIKQSCRKEDIVARWGGDEFLVFLPQTSLQAAEEIVARIQDKCAMTRDQPLKVSIALGIAQKVDKDTGLYHVINEAEEWMYHHKFLEGKSHRNALIKTMVATLYAKSTETQEHSDRLRDYCMSIGRQLKLSVKELDQLELLAMLHDIGKVGISESILQKSESLTEKEWEQMKKHPEIGFRIAQNIPELVHVAELILAHHERWDGKGYPQGLKKEEIPFLSRVFTVADAFESMTRDRTYRKAMSPQEALEEIRKNAGTQFDPRVVEAFLEAV